MTDKYDVQKQKLSELATFQQMSAADPGMSVWVEASAGTGKTKVLSDRVLRLLLNKVEPQKILCLTYTKAAAVEMNERIAKRLSNWSVISEEKLKKEISGLLGPDFSANPQQSVLDYSRTLFAQLLDTPGGMKIQTIHSFCQDILKRFPLEAAISPYFEVLDDRNAKEILQNIKLDLLKNIENPQNQELGQAVIYLTQNISEYRFPEVMNMITVNRGKINALLKKYNNDISFLISLLEQKLGVSIGTSCEELKKEFLTRIDINSLKFMTTALLSGTKTDVSRAEILSSVATDLPSPDLYDRYCSVFLTSEGEIRAKLATKDVVKKYPEVLEVLNQEAQNLLATQNKILSLSVLKTTAAVLHIAKNIIDNYNSYKEIYAVLDYEDLILTTRHLLEDSNVADWVLFKLDGGIDHILIDEAQDTSPNQWAIIRALTQEFFAGLGTRNEEELPRSVFVVGDRKQSIYSFQGADPQEFDKMCHYFQERIQNFSKVQLDVSFRSTKAVMDCVNTLFEDEIAKQGVIAANEHINHLPYRLGEGGVVEILPLIKEDKSISSDYNWRLPTVREQKVSLPNQLARLIASNIKDMVESGQILASQQRPVRYGDFMFLVQQRNVLVEEFVRACKSMGVKVAGVDKLKLLEQISVQDLISLGHFLLLPSDDLSLAEVLKSPIFGLDDNDLFQLCYERRDTLFSNLLKHKDYISVAEKLKVLLNMVGYARPFELFSYVLITMGGRKNFISRMGSEVEDILDEFINLTLIFEQNHTPCLQSFISWISQDEVIIQKEMEQGKDDTVKIMTVHGSKGLQAPIVILADTTRVKNKADKSEFLWDDDAVYFPPSASCYNDVCKNIKSRNLQADFDEYRRLLYVALTRAEDRLYIAGFTKDADANEQSWYKLLENNIKSNVSLPEDDKRIVYAIEQENNVEKSEDISENFNICLDDYAEILSPALVEDSLTKPFLPSHGEDETDVVASPLLDEGNFYKRGTVIHKLLQYISNLDFSHRQSASQIFLKKELPEFSDNEIQSIIREVIDLSEQYPQIFKPNSMAEVPIIGEVDGKIISAKIDRLVIEKDRIIIVDYKTNRPAARELNEVPQLYLQQLSCYKKLMEKLYPNKKIETYILWTNTCNMMKI